MAIPLFQTAGWKPALQFQRRHVAQTQSGSFPLRSLSFCLRIKLRQDRSAGQARCRAVGAFIAPSVHWGEPAFFCTKLEIEKMCKCLDEQYNAALLLASGNENVK
jgi:hypothetical protein